MCHKLQFFMLEFNYIILVFIIIFYSVSSTEKVNGKNLCYQKFRISCSLVYKILHALKLQL